eukprot:COSAG01_NODE_12529_length_1724_cov_114.307077_1_plen_305_part_10
MPDLPPAVPGQKRARDEAPALLNRSSSAAEVGEWLAAVLPPFEGRESVLGAFAHIDGAALIRLDEAGMQRLGLKKWGLRRKLWLLIKGLKLAGDPTANDHGSAPQAAAPAAVAQVVPPGSVAPWLRGHGAEPMDAAVHPAPSELDTISLDQEAVEAQLNAEASCLGVCQWSAKTMAKAIAEPAHAEWASPPMKQGREAALAELSATLDIPRASVVVVGESGQEPSNNVDAAEGSCRPLPPPHPSSTIYNFDDTEGSCRPLPLRRPRAELDGLARKLAAAGNTGAGKSTLLNALIGELEVLPTNGM